MKNCNFPMVHIFRGTQNTCLLKTEFYGKFWSETDAHEAAATFGIKKIEKKNRKKSQISSTETNVSGTDVCLWPRQMSLAQTFVSGPETNVCGLAGKPRSSKPA